MELLDVARATLRTTFRPRFELRVSRFFFDLRFVAKSSADYADAVVSESRIHLCKRKQDRTAEKRWSGGDLGYWSVVLNQPITPSLQLRSRPAHVRAGAGVDLDRFAFLDEKRHVNGLTGFELCRLGDVAGSIATNAFG